MPMHPSKGILGGSDFGTGLDWLPCRSLGCSHIRKNPKVLCLRVPDTVLSPSPLPSRITLLFQACTSVKRLECGFLYGVQSCLREGPPARSALARISLETSRKLWEHAILSGEGGMRYGRAGGSW